MADMTENALTKFEEGAVYQAEIVDQIVTDTADGWQQVVLTVSLKGRLKNPKNVSAGLDTCPPADVEVRITLDPEDPGRLGWAVRDLEAAGFESDDISLLHPEHPDHVSLLGRAVYVRGKLVAGRMFWNIARPPKATSIGTLKSVAAGLSAKIAAAKQQRRDGKAGRRGSNHARPQPPGTEPAAGGEGSA